MNKEEDQITIPISEYIKLKSLTHSTKNFLIGLSKTKDDATIGNLRIMIDIYLELFNEIE